MIAHKARPEEIFLRDIVTFPEDDGPRLVFADWLEEHAGPRGCARAEFIRLQCRLEHLAPDDPRREQLQERADRLRALHARAWLGPLYHPGLHWQFRRGFVTSLAHRGLFHRDDTRAGNNTHGWLRFYPDGAILAATTTKATADQVARWLHRQHPHAGHGSYSLCPLPRGLSVFFAIASDLATALCAGTLTGPCLVVDVHNHVTNYRAREHYAWEDVPGYDSCDS
jgi:uncharacterized protein (TIGR02996 family)